LEISRKARRRAGLGIALGLAIEIRERRSRTGEPNESDAQADGRAIAVIEDSVCVLCHVYGVAVGL
jgi:hypothetical protein